MSLSVVFAGQRRQTTGVTTTTSREAIVYRSHARRDGNTAFAAIVASVLTAVGTVSMIIGIGGVLGWFSEPGGRSAVLIGVGLFAVGAGALLLVVLQTWRIFTDR